VAFFGRPATLREDGRLLYEVSLYRVKTAAESHAAWDYYAELGRISAADAFLPISANC
jgi:branched-chain amino acid transport system substrate-binding protein